MKPATLLTINFAIFTLGLALSLQPNDINLDRAPSHRWDQAGCAPCPCLHKPERPFKRSYEGEVSIAPRDPLQQAPSSISNSNQTRNDNSKTTQWWPPSSEAVLTAVFRAVVTLLSLLNVNFTWRIHGMQIRSGAKDDRDANMIRVDIYAGHRWRPWARGPRVVGRQWPV